MMVLLLSFGLMFFAGMATIPLPARAGELDAVQPQALTGQTESTSSVTGLVATLQGRGDALEAELTSVRDLPTPASPASLALALAEIERLEQEHAEFQNQIAALGENLDEAKATLTGERLAFDEERQQRSDLETRAQIQEGTTIRLKDEDVPPMMVNMPVKLSSDLIPMIGQVEAATATAISEFKALRWELERERANFAMVLADKDAELAAINASHTQRVAGLEGDIEALNRSLLDRDQMIATLEEDLRLERMETVRVLAMASSTEEILSARIRELEVVEAWRGSESSSAASADQRSLFELILQLADNDKLTAIARFEALPEGIEVPNSVLITVGDLYREAADYIVAREIYKRLLARNSADHDTERKLVMTLFDMGHYEEALDRLARLPVNVPEGE